MNVDKVMHDQPHHEVVATALCMIAERYDISDKELETWLQSAAWEVQPTGSCTCGCTTGVFHLPWVKQR